MNKQTATNLFMLSPLTEHSGLYQQILKGLGSYQRLGNHLIQLGEQAHAFRQFDKVKEIGQLLSHIPVKNYQSIGYYFLAVAANNKGNGDRDEARRLFQLTIDTAPDAYKVKSILSLGALSFHNRDFDSAFYFFQETIKAGELSVASIQAIRGISILKTIEGHHNHALKDLENILPVIKYAPAHLYFDLLNSYAVELGETGRKTEARNISRIVLASPFIHAYPEWQETARNLREPDRSSVFIDSHSHVSQNVLLMPATRRGESVARYDEPARVLSMQKWKKKMGKDKKENEGRPPETPTKLQIINQIVLFYTNKNTTDEQRYKIWEAVAKIMYQPDSSKTEPDDSEGA